MNASSGRPGGAARSDGPWRTLADQVRDANPHPQDAMDVTALLESLGWTDGRAAEQYGFADLFAMGQALYADLTAVRHGALPPRPDLPWYGLLWRVLIQFPHGLAFALPIIISFAAMITLRISLNSYLYFDVLQATALALAVFLSFLATGGIVQAMANSVHLFLNMRETALARSTAWRLMRWGMGIAVCLALGVLAGDLIVPVLPLQLVLFMDVYLVLMSAMWLSFAGLYILRSEHWLSVITAGGVLVAYAGWRSGLPVVVAQAIALTLASIAALVTALILLARLAARNPARVRFIEPRASQLAYLAWPYFLYGTVYFVWVFLDRVVAWSTNGVFMPYYIWFRGEYELGLDWALLTLVLPLGAVEVLIHYVVGWLQSLQRAVPAERVSTLAAGLRRVYLQCAVAYAGAAVGSLVLTRLVVNWARGSTLVAAAVPSTHVELFTYTWATVAYVALAAGLFNILVMFSLLMPWPALRLIAIAIVLDFVVGMVLTRTTGNYADAIWGLVVSSAFLAAASTREVLRLMPKIDYLLYRMV